MSNPLGWCPHCGGTRRFGTPRQDGSATCGECGTSVGEATRRGNHNHEQADLTEWST